MKALFVFFGCLLLSQRVLTANSLPGQVVSWGWGATVPFSAELGAHFTKVAEGELFSLALQDDGSVMAWGRNVNGLCDVAAG